MQGCGGDSQYMCVCMLKGEFNGGRSYGAQSVIKYS